jgi:hypothetical protein
VNFRGRVRFRGNDNWNNNQQAFQQASPFPEDNANIYVDNRDQSGPNLRGNCPNGCTSCGQYPQAYAQAQVYESGPPSWYPSVEQPIYYPEEERNWRAYAWRNRDAAGLDAREAYYLRNRDDRNWRAYAYANRDDGRLRAYLALGQDEREAARAAWWTNRDERDLSAWMLVDERRRGGCDSFGLPIPDVRGRLDELNARILAMESRRGIDAELDARLALLERDRELLSNGMVAILKDRDGREIRRTRFGTRCPLCITLAPELGR